MIKVSKGAGKKHPVVFRDGGTAHGSRIVVLTEHSSYLQVPTELPRHRKGPVVL